MWQVGNDEYIYAGPPRERAPAVWERVLRGNERQRLPIGRPFGAGKAS